MINLIANTTHTAVKQIIWLLQIRPLVHMNPWLCTSLAGVVICSVHSLHPCGQITHSTFLAKVSVLLGFFSTFSLALLSPPYNSCVQIVRCVQCDTLRSYLPLPQQTKPANSIPAISVSLSAIFF